MSLNDATKKLMADDVARVRAAHATALKVATAAADGWLSDGAAAAVLKQVKDQGATMEKWAGAWRQLAEQGKDNTGAPASNAVDAWRRTGQDLSDFFTYAGKQAKYTLLSTVVADTVKETGATVAAAVDPLKWGLGTQLLVGGVAVLLGLYLLARVRGAALLPIPVVPA